MDVIERIERVEAEHPGLKVGFPEIGKGWVGIAERALHKLGALIPDGAECTVLVKSKYGILDITPMGIYDGMDAVIEEAEEESRTTCERCGKPGEAVSKGGWITVLCKECE